MTIKSHENLNNKFSDLGPKRTAKLQKIIEKQTKKENATHTHTNKRSLGFEPRAICM